MHRRNNCGNNKRSSCKEDGILTKGMPFCLHAAFAIYFPSIPGAPILVSGAEGFGVLPVR
jgi:hypothetical protein